MLRGVRLAGQLAEQQVAGAAWIDEHSARPAIITGAAIASANISRYEIARRIAARLLQSRSAYKLIRGDESARLRWAKNLAPPAGFEPTAPGLGILCSIRLS